MNTLEILSKSKDVLDEHGWCQGDFVNDNGAKCAIGAIRWVVLGESNYMGANTEIDVACGSLERVLMAWVNSGAANDCDIVNFNDDNATEYQDIVRLFDEAIAYELTSIGKPERTIEVTPLEEPVPTPIEMPETTPAAPTPEKVPVEA